MGENEGTVEHQVALAKRVVGLGLVILTLVCIGAAGVESAMGAGWGRLAWDVALLFGGTAAAIACGAAISIPFLRRGTW